MNPYCPGKGETTYEKILKETDQCSRSCSDDVCAGIGKWRQRVSQEETTVAAEIQAEKSESVLPEKSEESRESVEESVGEITETVSEESIEQSILESVPETETESNAELEEAVESEETTEELAEETTEESTEAAHEVEKFRDRTVSSSGRWMA